MTESGTISHMIEDLVPHEDSAGLLLSVDQALDGDYIHPEKYLCHITTLLRVISNIHHLSYANRGIALHDPHDKLITNTQGDNNAAS